MDLHVPGKQIPWDICANEKTAGCRTVWTAWSCWWFEIQKCPWKQIHIKETRTKSPWLPLGEGMEGETGEEIFTFFCTYLYKLILKDKIKKNKIHHIQLPQRVCCKILLWQHKLSGHWKAVYKVRYKTLLLFKREEVLVCLSKIFTLLTSLSHIYVP